MNRFLKINSPWLGLLGLAVVIVILAFIFRPKSPEYEISANQTLKLINDNSMQVAIKDIAEKQLIDIRSTDLFAQGHPENAINIPGRKLLDKESVELFDQLLENGKGVILYGGNELQAIAPFFLLQQLGYTNVKYLQGGITDSGELRVTELASTEVSVVDTAAMRTKPVLLQAKEATPEKKKPQVIVPVRKEASSGGGC